MPRAKSIDKLHRDKRAGRHWKSKGKTELLKLMNQSNIESMNCSDLTSTAQNDNNKTKTPDLHVKSTAQQ